MNVYIYMEVTRKSRGEETQYLQPVAELEDFDTIDAALEALVDEAPELLGTEFVIFTEAPEYITVGEPTAKYSFSRRGDDSEADEEEEPEAEEYEEEGEEEEYEDEEAEEEEPEEEAPAPKRAAKKRPAKKAAAKKRPAKKAAAKKAPASKRTARAGTRVGSSKRTPFTRNAASTD